MKAFILNERAKHPRQCNRKLTRALLANAHTGRATHKLTHHFGHPFWYN